jgi:YHS domain-containing protein
MHKDKDEKVLEHVDPVCGMSINTDTAASTHRFEGETFYFCSDDCKRKFEMQPDEYAKSVVPK